MMVAKVFIVLDDEEQLILRRIYFDEDPAEALDFVLKHIIPKAGKDISCLSGMLSGTKG